jgi:hypothetical protein
VDQHLLLPGSVADAIAASGAAWGAFGVVALWQWPFWLGGLAVWPVASITIHAQAVFVSGGAAALPGKQATAAMLIGDRVIYEGQAYVVVGFTPIGVTPAEAQLRSPHGGEGFWVERRLISQPVAPERAALRWHKRRER